MRPAVRNIATTLVSPSLPALGRASPPPHIAGPAPGTRRNIWELRSTSPCSIVGTCITLPELRKIAKKLRLIDDKRHIADYDLHGLAVSRLDSDNDVSRALQKHLDAKFEGLIRKAKSLSKDESFIAFWEEAIDNGFMPGAYWACLTHPALSAVVERRLFGEVHMMSHICGATNRGDARAAAEARRVKAELARRLAGQIAERNERLQRQDIELRSLRATIRELQSAAFERDRLREMLATDDMPKRIACLEGEKAAHCEENERLRRFCRGLELQNDNLRSRLDESAVQVERLRHQASRGGRQPGHSTPIESDDARDADLCGFCLLYVGGRPQTVCRLKEWVEHRNGELLHHDGGLEQSAGVLAEMVRRADVVLFPVDCVSHGAAGSVKSLCERHGKRLCPLRTASATTFQKAIRKHFLVGE